LPFNGSGVFTRVRNWVNDAAGGIAIRADLHDSEDDNLASGLTQCITKDGQTTVTANLPMSTYRHTGVGAAVNLTDYARYDQLLKGAENWAVAGGTADAITASYTVPILTLVDGQLFFFRSSAANATTTPTFSPNGLTARTIVKNGGDPLAAGDIPDAGYEVILRYNLTNTEYEMLNPSTASLGALAFLDTVGTAEIDDESVTVAKIDSDAATSGQVLEANGTGGAAFVNRKGTLQRRVVSTGAYDSSTTVIPLDNTIPQISEGEEILTYAFTPVSATSTIVVEVIFEGVDGAGGARFVAAIFKDAGVNAINAGFTYPNGGLGGAGLVLNHEEVSGSLTARTYSVRYGPDTAGTAYVNGQSSGARLGGVCLTKMIITEYNL
jgi:hypothetical protein